MRRNHLALPLRALALLVPALLATTMPLYADDEKKPTSVFEDQALLEKHLAEACDMVEAIEEREFEQRPTIRISTPDEVAAVLTKEFESFPETMIPAAQRKTFAKSIAGLLMAKYEPARNIVHMIPAGVALIEKAQPKLEKLGLDHLRALLAHEVTHAMDFRRYDIMAMRSGMKDTDAHQALNAIVEGHAQFVAEEAAKRWKITPAFERLTAAIVGTGAEEGTDVEKAMRAAALSQIRFAYGQGHEFFRAVAKAEGKEGVDRAMREPPAKSRMIEKPELWLNPTETEAGPDLKSIATAFAWLAPEKGWVAADQRVLENGLRAQGQRVPPERRAEWLQGFQDAHLYQAQNPLTGDRVIVVALHFNTEANAKVFVALDKLIVETAKPQPGMTMDTKRLDDGVGPKGAYHGFSMHRIVKYMGQTIDMRQQVMSHGTIGIEMLVINAKHIDDAHVNTALERAVAWIDDPAAAAKLPALETPTPKVEAPPKDDEKPEAPKPDEPKKDAPKKEAPKKDEPAGAGK